MSHNPQLKSYSKTVYDTLLQAYRPFIVKIILLLFVGFAGRYLILSNAQIIGQFLDQHAEINSENMIQLFYKMLLIAAASFVLTGVFRTFFSTLSCQAVSRIYDETTYRVSRFPITFFESQPVGRITTRFSSDYGNIFRLFGGPLAEFLSILFDLLSITLLMTLIHPLFLITLLVSGGVYTVLLKRHQAHLREIRRQLSARRAPSIAHFSETVQGSTIIRQNHRERHFMQKFREFDSDFLAAKWSAFWRVTRFSLELNVLSTFLFAANGLICISLIHSGSLGIGLATVVLSFTILATNTLQMFFEWFSQFEEAFTAVEKLDEYIRHPIEPGVMLPSYSDFSTSHPKKSKTPAYLVVPSLESTSPQAHLQVENLTFSYPSSTAPILESVSFKLKKGEKLGLVGRTGSGKTTLISALLRLYPIEHGVILINGRQEPDVEVHRSLFSVISQDQLFVTGTIRDNLDLFRKAQNHELETLLKKVGLQCKLNDPVTERGQNLSYGEKQLLSLARGLLQKAEIFIFDEATSNVDPQSEALMNRALKELLADKTQIRIAHRLQTVEDCNYVLWLDRGHIKKLGPTQEVLVAFKESR